MTRDPQSPGSGSSGSGSGGPDPEGRPRVSSHTTDATAAADAEAPDYGPLRWRSRVVRAWTAALACGIGVWMLGGDAFSAANTAKVLRPVIDLFVSDFSRGDMFALLTAIRKSMHVAVYGFLALLIIRALWIGAMDSFAVSLGLTFVAVAAMALADETRQAYSPVRTGSGWDVVLDLTGAVLVGAALLALQLGRRTPLFEPERGQR